VLQYTAAMDVLACGELLVDLFATEIGSTLAQAIHFQKAPGGAPANVAVGLARLGHAVGFLGQVGDDAFGHFLADTLTQFGVDTGGLRFTTEARTALAFVSLRPGGEPDFMFYRHPSADMLRRAEDVDPSYVAQARIFHFGSLSLIQEPARTATLTAARYAADSGALLSYDPNLRLALWPSIAAAKDGMLDGWRLARVIKVNSEELFFLREERTLEGAVRALWHEDLALVAVTVGGKGCTYFTADSTGYLPGFPVGTVDTTGAGDAFMAGLLSGLLEASGPWHTSAIERAVTWGNAVGALSTTRIGAMSALPTRAEVQRFLSDSGRGFDAEAIL
jgi:fructokinase